MLNVADLSRLKRYRFPRSVIGYAVWAYHCSNLYLRDAENLLAERGIVVSYETIRTWMVKFGPQIAAKDRQDRPAPASKWYLGKVVIPIRSKKHWLWSAIASNGDVLYILVQSQRNWAAALRFFRKLFKHWGKPRVLVTDKLRSYGAALHDLAPGIERRQHKGLNNRSEESHRHTRRREKVMGQSISHPASHNVSSRCTTGQRRCLDLSDTVFLHALTAQQDLMSSDFRPHTRPTSPPDVWPKMLIFALDRTT